MARAGIRKPGSGEDRTVWMRWVRAVDPETGKPFMALRALPGDDADEVRERGYAEGQVVSAELRSNRNLLNFRQAHALAKFVRDNTEAFPEDMDSHDVLKRLQLDGDIECEEVEEQVDLGVLDLGELGKVELGVRSKRVRKPRSLAFGKMTQEVWKDVYGRLERYMVSNYFPDWTAKEKAEFDRIVQGNQPPWPQ